MKERAERSVGSSGVAALATLSVVALVTVGAWQIYQAFARGNPVYAENKSREALPDRAATPYGNINWQAPVEGIFLADESAVGIPDPDGISNIEGNVAHALLSSYAALSEAGVYTPAEGQKIAEEIAGSLQASVSYKLYTAKDVATDVDSSYDRMLAYRNDLRLALEPLLGNPGYELGLFANYIESQNPHYTNQLKAAAENYQIAVEQAATMTIPEDAVSYHVGILNALSQFGAIVDRMADHGNDAFAAAALLQTYNGSEAKLFTSFDSLAGYFTSRHEAEQL